uniref:Uncharacterized protein n=1 Tax=Coccidioides posadasii RMSCC 3488 TaxID=454284 RepID=A0A0J6F3Z2_COCPO|nr:hypothetical protein CPAG_00362 [Coccidioides posadasii RMSCC 3488]
MWLSIYSRMNAEGATRYKSDETRITIDLGMEIIQGAMKTIEFGNLSPFQGDDGNSPVFKVNLEKRKERMTQLRGIGWKRKGIGEGCVEEHQDRDRLLTPMAQLDL